MYRNFVKPFLDVFVASVSILLLSPVYLVLSLCVLTAFQETPFFTQLRVGKNNKIFKIYKFKSMNNKRDDFGHLLPDAERLTKFGILLRRSSLDELPQLFNIIFGQMSFIGPRPLPPAYLSLYNSKHQNRTQVKPGISGWAQVNGRNNVAWLKKFDMDLYYIEHQSMILDIEILLKTVKIVLSSEGVSSEGNATTEPFTGNN